MENAVQQYVFVCPKRVSKNRQKNDQKSTKIRSKIDAKSNADIKCSKTPIFDRFLTIWGSILEPKINQNRSKKSGEFPHPKKDGILRPKMSLGVRVRSWVSTGGRDRRSSRSRQGVGGEPSVNENIMILFRTWHPSIGGRRI